MTFRSGLDLPLLAVHRRATTWCSAKVSGPTLAIEAGMGATSISSLTAAPGRQCIGYAKIFANGVSRSRRWGWKTLAKRCLKTF